MVEGLYQMHVDHTVASGAELIMGHARFVGPRTVEVNLNSGEGKRTISGDRVFLDLGSRVTVIEAASQLASREDPDVGAALLDLFVDEGIDVLLGIQVRSVEGRCGDRIRVRVADKRGERAIDGTDLLVAVGRKANSDGVGLEQTGVELNEHGYIRVNERLETTSANVWAMGDCAGSPQFTHVAFDDFRVVYANLNGGNRTTKNRLIPFCMFTDPELAGWAETS